MLGMEGIGDGRRLMRTARSPLEDLAAVLQGEGGRVVALGALGPRTLADLRRAGARVHGMVRGSSPWLLACEDPFDFLSGLIGLAAAGVGVMLPPNHLPETLHSLSQEAAGMISGAPPRGPEGVLSVLHDVDLVFWTSGSTGQPKAIRRKLSQLLDEVRILEGLFGDRFQEGPVLGTVPHHHIYGCLFRVLWPLMAGRAFVCLTTGHPDHLSQPHGALVSSPAHLSRMLKLVDFSTIRHPVSVVFSSGGPLSREDALAWRPWVRDGVLEVYGSTESGGLAWREQGEEPTSARWTPFPDVEITRDPDGALRALSPRVEGGVLRMEDQIRWHPEGRFELLGRLDRVVKVEEKRVSLPELEAALLAFAGVKAAAVVLLEDGRRCLGAVVTLEALPRTPQARRFWTQQLREHLGRRFDPVLLPRRWRFVESLPTDSRGKTTRPDLLALFSESHP